MTAFSPVTAPFGRVTVILASASLARAAMLRAVGIAFETSPARVDEEAIRAALRDEGAEAAAIAATLAETKALAVARSHADRLVIGADQILDCGGVGFDKPADRAAATEQLRALSGRTHEQVAAVAVVRGGMQIWHHVERTRLTMRTLDETFIAHYLDAAGDAALGSPGAYQIEGLGAQLFTRIDGDFFTVIGLPLLPLLDCLRTQGAVPG